MYYSNQPTSKRLITSREAIEIVQADPLFIEALREVGFVPEEMATGGTYQKEAERLHSTQDVEYGNQVTATKAVTDIASEIRTKFVVDRRIAITAFKSLKGVYRQLRLTGSVSKINETLYTQASHFYTELLNNEEVQARMAEFGTTIEMLNNRLELLAAMAEAMKAQQIQVGQAQITTAQRQEAMRRLDKWMARFIKAARFAFQDDPKQLKKLGIHVKE